MKIESRAPTRMDLAGGTVDIWPLYLFLDQPATINLAINLHAEAKIESSQAAIGSDGKIVLKSGDQGAQQSLRWDELDQAMVPPSLELHVKLLRYFRKRRDRAGGFDPRENFTLSTAAKSPAGAGLGGSSTLSIAMVGALAAWADAGKHGDFNPADPQRDGERWIKIVRDAETTVIQVPAGLQDYYGAMYGGLQSIRWLPGFHERKWLAKEILAELESKLLLFYSGQSRNSGINNWALFKAFIDRQGKVREQFAGIAAAANELENALQERDWKAVGSAIAKEWEIRHTLAPGISTREMDAAFASARAEGATAGKVCGAGGGGCFFVYVPSGDPQLKTRIEQKITSKGIRSLPFQAAPKGLEVQVTG